MSAYRRYSKEEIEELEKSELLWTCEACDYECHCDSVGETCPKCGAKSYNDEDTISPSLSKSSP
jgi:rubrerythrin